MFFRIQQRTTPHVCLAPRCKNNASPTYRNRVCAKHKDLDEETIYAQLLLRDKQKKIAYHKKDKT